MVDDTSAQEGEDAASEASEKTEETVIPVRSSASHIIKRQADKIEKLRGEAEGNNDDFVPPSDDDEGLTPEASTAVATEVAKQVKPLTEALVSKSDEDELQGLFADNPEASEYEKQIRAYMSHDSYSGVPPSVIYHHLAFDSAENKGTQRRHAADVEAAQSRGGGSQRRPTESSVVGTPSAEDIDNMSDEDFSELEAKALAGAFVKDN